MKTIGSSVSALSSFLGFYLQNGRRGSEGDAQFVKRLKEAARDLGFTNDSDGIGAHLMTSWA